MFHQFLLGIGADIGKAERGTSRALATPPGSEVRGTRSESPESVISEDSLDGGPTSHRGNRTESLSGRARHHGRFEDDDSDEDGRSPSPRRATRAGSSDIRERQHRGYIDEDSDDESPSPNPRRASRPDLPENHMQQLGRFDSEDPRERTRPDETPTVHAVGPAGFETDALDDDALARLLANPPSELLHEANAGTGPKVHHPDALDDEALAQFLANPPPEMLEQAKRASVPGALDDAELEQLLKQQQDEIYEGGWRHLIKDLPPQDHLDDDAYEDFLAQERRKVSSGETDAFPFTQRHPDALDDDELARVIADLGFERHPLRPAERGGPSIPRSANLRSGDRSRGSNARRPQAATPTTEPPPYVPESPTSRSGAFEEALGAEAVDDDERPYRGQTEERPRRPRMRENRSESDEVEQKLASGQSDIMSSEVQAMSQVDAGHTALEVFNSKREGL